MTSCFSFCSISSNLGKPLGDTVFKALGFDVIGRSWKIGKIMGSEDQMKESLIKSLIKDKVKESEAADVVEKSFVLCDFTNPDYIKPIDHPRAMMQTLKDYGVKVAIATTDNRIGTEMVIDNLDLWPTLDASICCGEDHGTRPKPDPINIEIICKTVGVPPERTVVIGDTTGDIKMGKEAGCQMSVGVLCGVGKRPELEAIGPNFIVPSTVDVLPFLLPDGFLHVFSKHVTNLSPTSSAYAQAWHAQHTHNINRAYQSVSETQ